MRFVLAAVVVVQAALVLCGCEDPCVTLADRICNCELTSGARSTCRTERIVNQQSSVKITDADRAFCSAKLDTCTCDALDTDDLEACGFAFEDNGQ